MKSATICLLLVLTVPGWRIASGDSALPIAYPEGYRDWTHVKSALMSPQHAKFASMGGFHHIYANALAMKGYRTGEFAEGSVVVFDWLRMEEKDGMFIEGARRRIDVMVRDSERFATTGGWGFERFVGDSKTERALTPSTRDRCFTCHQRLQKNGLVLSRYRP